MVKSSVRAKKRLKKEAVYRSFVWQKPLRRAPSGLRPPLALLAASWRLLRRDWPAFSLLGLIFLGVAFVLFLSASPAVDLEQLYEARRQGYTPGALGALAAALAILPDLIALVGQYFLDTLAVFTVSHLALSLSLWWLIRQLSVARRGRLKVRDAFYFGPAQIVPFSLLAIVLSLQLLPALIAADFASQLRLSQTLSSNWEQAGALVVLFLIFALCFYWLIGGFFSLIVASLPGTRPFQAWQTSLQLTHRRRLAVAGRLSFLVCLAALAVCLLALPFLIFVPGWAEYGFYAVGLGFMIFGHIYCFLLYGDLLKLSGAGGKR